MRLVLALAVALALPSSAADKKLEKMWKTKCQSCHGSDGTAQTDKGKKMQIVDLSSPQWQSKKSDDDIRRQIKDGMKSEKNGVKKEMDSYADLSEEQLSALVAHIRSFAKK